jgi:hypothetical protein
MKIRDKLPSRLFRLCVPIVWVLVISGGDRDVIGVEEDAGTTRMAVPLARQYRSEGQPGVQAERPRLGFRGRSFEPIEPNIRIRVRSGYFRRI